MLHAFALRHLQHDQAVAQSGLTGEVDRSFAAAPKLGHEFELGKSTCVRIRGKFEAVVRKEALKPHVPMRKTIVKLADRDFLAGVPALTDFLVDQSDSRIGLSDELGVAPEK